MSYQAKFIFENEIKTRGAKIPFGIHTDCKVNTVIRGQNFVDINFEDSEGRHHNKRLWDPNGNYPLEGETPAQALERESNTNLSHIVKLLHIFIGEAETFKVTGETYDDFVKKAITLLTKKLSSKKVNLKLIYDTEGIYSTFGKFPDYIEEFIEGEDPKLFFSKYEKEQRITFKGTAK